jgi:hypothetical protein
MNSRERGEEKEFAKENEEDNNSKGNEVKERKYTVPIWISI